MMGWVERSPRRGPFFRWCVLPAIVALVLGLTPALPAGGVVVVSTDLSDNGDDDGFADTNETVSMRLTVENTSGLDLTGVVARLRNDQPLRACIIDPLVSIGDLAAGETRATAATFTFQVTAGVERSTIVEDLALSFDVSISSDQVVDAALRQGVTVALDLDSGGGAGPASFFESFESGDFGTFTESDLDLGLHGDNAASDGYRCQYDDPDWSCGASYGCVTDCFLGATATQADAYHWQIDGPSALDGGRASTGTHSLYMGIPLADGLGHTTPLAILEAAGMTNPIHIGVSDVCSETRTTICQSDVDCPTGESCVPVTPTLSFRQQISLLDWRSVSALPGRSLDRAVVQAQVVDDPSFGDWIKLDPFLNTHDAQAEDRFTNCTFDPIDDGNTEDDVFDPYASPRYGPSSSCYPEYVFAYLGNTDAPFDPLGIGNASDGPGLPGASGLGTWIETKFDLSRFRGRSIRLRFLISSFKVGTFENWEQFFAFNPNPGDDGWWIDDVHVTDNVTTPATTTIDTNDNSGLPSLPDTDGDTVFDACDNCPAVVNPDQADADADGAGDACDACPLDAENDADGDGVCGDQDNCLDAPNPDQLDGDGDGVGDACDNCPELANCDAEACQVDSDGDGLGDACDPCPVGDFDDPDADGVGCIADNCRGAANPDQLDSDGDGAGDACDGCPFDPLNDIDVDGVCGDVDNCPTLGNPDQSPAVNFSGPLAPQAPVGVRSFATSDDGQWVVYRAGIDEEEAWPQLYSRRLIGGPRVKLHGSPTAGVDKFRISPDSSTVVLGTNRLLAVPIGGGPPVVLESAAVEDLAISPDGANVVYTRFFCSGSCREDLYRVPIDGSAAPLRLAEDLERGFTISPDSSRIVFVKYQPGQTLLTDLYSVPIDGGAIVRLNPPLVTNGAVGRWAISGDSATVAYWGDQDVDNFFELYTVPIVGGTAKKLSFDNAGGIVNGNFELSPDGTTIVFNQLTDDHAIYSVPITGGTPVTLSPPGGSAGGPEISPDSGTVVFQGALPQHPTYELFAVPILGGTVTPLSMQSGFYQITPDGNWVVYADAVGGGSDWSVYRVPIDGTSPPVELSPGGSGNFGASDVKVSPDSTTVAFRGRPDFSEPYELHAVSIAGGPVERLNGELVPGGDVASNFAFEPQSSGVFYVADQQTDEVDELYLRLFDPDLDEDGILDVCDPCRQDPINDPDADGLCASVDLCPFDADPGQEDVDGDGVGDACDNCRREPNPGQGDGDGDGEGDDCDCAPANPDGREPDEVQALTATKTNPQTARIGWSATVAADHYSVTRGPLSSLDSASYGVCLATGIVPLEFIDGDVPAVSQGYAYLVQGVNLICGPGMLGEDSSGAERINGDPGACP